MTETERRRVFLDRGARLPCVAHYLDGREIWGVPSPLRRGELRRQEKKEHLYGKGVRGEEAEEILAKLYPGEAS